LNLIIHAMQGHVPLSYLQLLERCLVRSGLGAGSLPGGDPLPGATQALVDAGQPQLPVQQWAACLAAGQNATGNPAFGLRVGELVSIQDLGLMGYVALSCSTVGEALMRWQEFERLSYDVNPVKVSTNQHGVELCWGDEHGRPGQLVDECALAILMSTVRSITGDATVSASTVSFINPQPADTTPYTSFFGCNVQFGAHQTKVHLASAVLDMPLRQPDPVLLKLLEGQAQSQLVRLPPRDPWMAKLRDVLTDMVKSGEGTLGEAATRMGCSVRTLQRQLAKGGAQFQTELDRSRCAQALIWLRDSTLSTAEVAIRLGYADQAAFTRAFSRWTGQTPGRWRKQAPLS